MAPSKSERGPESDATPSLKQKTSAEERPTEVGILQENKLQ